MIQLNDFLREVGSIAYERPTYRIRGRGADGTCDCVGLIIGSMYRNGHAKYPLHSSNYFARYETEDLEKINSDTTLEPGMVVYKAREDKGQLDERYRTGGAHHAGDSLDYYHVGVVTQSDPLEITHCTQTNNVNGIARDTTTKGWTQFGWVKGVTPSADGYTSSGPSGHLPLEGEGNMEGETGMSYRATVTAANGQPVKVRSSPNAKNEKNVITKLPVGMVVDVLEEGESDGVMWSTVTSGPLRGYMMSRFLKADLTDDDAPAPSAPVVGYEAIMEKLDEILEAIAALGGAG